MHHELLSVLGLLSAVFLLVMLAQRIRVAYPIFLVVAGLIISFAPGIPHFHLAPDVIFLLFLPPLLYEAAWYTSWKDFWKLRRPISLLAFGLVFFTSMVVAYASAAFIPGFSLALGFLLGGIVSPPDAIAATTVLKGLKVPKKVVTMLEGESLINDASSLIVFRFALAAILTGAFSLEQASGQFFIVAGMGIVVGVIGGSIMYAIHKHLPTTAAIDAALTVMTPYLLFLAAEHFHFSGVMAVVSGGLFISWRSHEIFQTGSTRMNMLGVWTTMIFVMNALVFVLIGLELPAIMGSLADYSVWEAIRYGLIISAIAIILRFLWVYLALYIPDWLNAKNSANAASWKIPFVISWAGMRGVVSLATALSIPLYVSDGVAFPQRNLIIFIAFVVIFVTLVFQGLSLPSIIRLIKLEDAGDRMPSEEQQAGIQLRLDNAALRLLRMRYVDDIKNNELVGFYVDSLESQTVYTRQRLESLECMESERREIARYHEVLLEVYGMQRKMLFQLRKDNEFSDAEIRKAEQQVDLNELQITGLGH